MSGPGSRRSWTAAIGFAVWSAVILAATVPWTDMVGHTHWRKVQWIPFKSPPVKAIDIVINVLLYVPFGYAWMRASPFRARLWHPAALAFVLSFAVEWSQLYSHSRFPSVQDVLCNVWAPGLARGWRRAERTRAAHVNRWHRCIKHAERNVTVKLSPSSA
jgi:glycopeptide antibiotics resistance protein